MIFGKRSERKVSTKRIIIVDPSLKSRAGHAYHASRSIVRTAGKAGFDAIILGPQAAEIPSGPGFQLRKCSSRSLYGRTDWSFAAYEAAAALLGSEIASEIGGDGRSACGIVLPTCDQAQLRAVGMLIEQRVLPQWLPILGWLLFPPRWNAVTADDAEAQFLEYHDALARLAKLKGEQGVTWLCCETDRLREQYSALPGADIRLAPAPSLADDGGEIATSRSERAAAPHFAVAGHATKAKGYELLPDALCSVLAENAAVRFTIHGVVAGAGNPEAREIQARLARLGPRVTVLTHDLSSEEYYSLLSSADALLLPYRLPDYRHRGSGIFNESLRLGIPVVAPVGSEFAFEAIRDKRAVGMKDHSAASLAAAIAETLRNLSMLRVNCQLKRGGNANAPTITDDFICRLSTRA
jgi:glycosyltransferase involved in cell wall biosynthesis